MEYTRYVTHRRARFNGYGGRRVNIPYGAVLAAEAGEILFDGTPLCFHASQNARLYFSQDDDGRGLERGKLVEIITDTLAKRDAGHQARWDRVWTDPVANRYRDQENADFWEWSQEFFDAPVDDLRHIATLVGNGPWRCRA